MNKRQKEIVQHQLDSEKAVLEQIERQYQKALNDINTKIRLLQSDELTQSKAYQVEYQKALKGQVEAILEKLHGDEYSTIQQFLADSYTDAFIGTVYDMHGQGVPVIMPIDQEAAVKAIQTDSQISKGLYDSLGVDTTKLKKSISSEITRGIVGNMSTNEIARNITNTTKAPLGRAKTIVRTESHRIHQASTMDAQNKAKSRGADVVKQWNSTLDGDTRPVHRRLDGQIREIDEPFEYGGQKAMAPGHFGDPAEDCNCRCLSLTRAKWALGEDELKTLKDRAKFFGLDKTKDFDDFKKKYLETTHKPNYTVLEKLKYSGKVTPAIEASLGKSLLKMPEQHRTLAESKISGIEVTDSQKGSCYIPRTGVIQISEDADPDDIIHEYAHAMAEALQSYDDPEFIKIMKKGLEDIKPEDIILDEETFVEPIYRIESEKFVNEYQGRLYEEFGIFDGKEISLLSLRDYLPSGYEEYINNPNNLKTRDPELFNYFEGIK